MNDTIFKVFYFFKTVGIFKEDIINGDFGDLTPNTLLADIPDWKKSLSKLAKTEYPSLEDFQAYTSTRHDETLERMGIKTEGGDYTGYPGWTTSGLQFN